MIHLCMTFMLETSKPGFYEIAIFVGPNGEVERTKIIVEEGIKPASV